MTALRSLLTALLDISLHSYHIISKEILAWVLQKSFKRLKVLIQVLQSISISIHDFACSGNLVFLTEKFAAFKNEKSSIFNETTSSRQIEGIHSKRIIQDSLQMLVDLYRRLVLLVISSPSRSLLLLLSFDLNTKR